MRRRDLHALIDSLAPVIRGYVATALHGLQTRVTVTEQALPPLQAAFQKSMDIVADYAKENAALRERIAILEAKPPMPGPPGEPGPAGKDGDPGKPGLEYMGVFQPGKDYDKGQCVTWDGSVWHCNEPGAAFTGPRDGAKGWTLMVKRGQAGKDAK